MPKIIFKTSLKLQHLPSCRYVPPSVKQDPHSKQASTLALLPPFKPPHEVSSPNGYPSTPLPIFADKAPFSHHSLPPRKRITQDPFLSKATPSTLISSSGVYNIYPFLQRRADTSTQRLKKGSLPEVHTLPPYFPTSSNREALTSPITVPQLYISTISST